jgi:hypothetical protein
MNADECRRQARDCLDAAEQVKDSEIKATMVQMARAWALLAQQSEQHNDAKEPADSE